MPLGLPLALLACSAPAPEGFAVSVDARSEVGAPLEGVRVWFDEREIGATDRLGRVTAERFGRPGDRFTLSVTCPLGRHADSPVRTVHLRRIASASGSRAPIEVRVTCAAVRAVVPIVIAATGPGDLALPVLIDGRVVAHTDATGTAHALIEVEPGVVVQLALDTASRPELRPQHPTQALRIESPHAMLLVSQRFDTARHGTPRKRAAILPDRARIEPMRPYRIH